MGRVRAVITMSLDGCITGPNDGPDRGLGDEGERLHSWVFGGRWRYDDAERGQAAGADAAWLDQAMATVGAVVAGRWTYEAAGHWGGSNPFAVPLFIVTHRPQEQPESGGFIFVSGVAAAVERARAAAAGRDVHVMGGADVIRQAMAAGLVDDLSLIVAPVIMGAGKRLFDGFHESLDLEHAGVQQSPFATFIDYRIHALTA